MTVKMFSDYEAITFSREGRILTVTLNRADTLNAVNAKLHEELARVFTDVQRDPESDVVVEGDYQAGVNAAQGVGWGEPHETAAAATILPQLAAAVRER